MSITNHNQAGKPLTPNKLTEVLIKHYGLHTGKYDLLIEFQIGTGMLGPSPENTCPTAMVGVAGIGLIESLSETANTVDAAMINPLKKRRSTNK